MPPALLLSAQGIFATLLGMAGMTLAAPITASGMMAIRMYYLCDVLGEPAEGPLGANPDRASPDPGRQR